MILETQCRLPFAKNGFVVGYERTREDPDRSGG